MRDIGALLRPLRRLLFGLRCIGCGEMLRAISEIPLCPACHAQFCASRTAAGGGRMTVDHLPVYSLLVYRSGTAGRGDAVSRMLLSRKQRLNPETEAFLAEQTAPLCETVITEHTGDDRNGWVLTYPPRSGKRRREVGHDQSYELARRLSRITGITLWPCFVRREGADTAQKTLGASERAANAADSCMLARRYRNRIRGKRVLIIDDITTTGATLAACASLLRQAGAAEAAALTIARSIQEHR